jgi:hypothetical protein
MPASTTPNSVTLLCASALTGIRIAAAAAVSAKSFLCIHGLQVVVVVLRRAARRQLVKC